MSRFRTRHGLDAQIDRRGGITALIALAQTQLLAQMLDSDGVDGRSMGVLGINGALAGADLAARSLFGGEWWIPLPGLAISAAILLGVRRGLRVEIGPSPHGFYAAYGGGPEAAVNVQLLSDLDDVLKTNDRTLLRKERRLAAAIAALLATIVYSTSAFA